VHRPVLLEQVVDVMAVRTGGVYVDATVGSGGHARAILERTGPEGRLLGIDRDEEALGRARRRLEPWKERCRLVHGEFGALGRLAAAEGFAGVDGVLMDLGMSAEQLESPERGFSLAREGPLDMRMDRSQTRTAAELLRLSPEDELARLLRALGEEPLARRIARALVRARGEEPIRTTGRLAGVVLRAKGGRRGRIHPATKTFQALRMAVNDELGQLEKGLASALPLLRPGGRLAVISFHSLEDRMVKRCFARHAGRWVSLPEGGRRRVGAEPRVRRVTRGPVTAREDEVRSNPRSRSAKLRVVERLAHDTKTEEK
jgi:16S rRNA (cytosine1402-N4)-methyltransferase